ncbi:PilN domain-containing protein [Aliidongia dinghuensis]|uniref:PilN domain-containing protein n=1 Tax=Aliidongia dinghuensis TaxID=1867774 RepID=UPI00166D6BA0|nr:PilN domain-containing protein [Aliidongia dinghuensis]
MAELLRTGLSSTLLSDAWHWWLDELRGLVPPTVAQKLSVQPSWLVLDLSDNSLTFGEIVGGRYQRNDAIDLLEATLPARPAAITASLRKSSMSPDRLAVTLAPRQVLRRTLDLPLTAPRHLRALVQHELERCQPLPTDQIHFDCRIVSRDPARHRMRVELAIAKRSTIDQVSGMLAGWGLTPRKIGLRDSGTWSFDFLKGETRPRSLRPTATASLAVLCLALSLGVVKVTFDRHEAYANTLYAAVLEAKAAAEHVEATRRQADALADRLTFLATERAAGQSGPWLEALSALLPDGTWVVDVERHGASLRLRGYSRNASALVGLLDASPRFANARFTAPLTPAAVAGVERFDLTVELRPGGAG